MKAIEETYLHTDEVGEKLRRTAAEVSRMCKRGQLRAVQVGRTWLIPESAVEELLTPKPAPAVQAVAEVEPPRFVTASQKRRHQRQAS